MLPQQPILRVFLSSTAKDLQKERQAAFNALHSLGTYTDDMIYWSAEGVDGATASVERVKRCDVVILIVAHRYGYVPQGQLYSITEMEYRTAIQAKIPVLAFFLDESLPWPPNYIEHDRKNELAAFKQFIGQNGVYKTFTDTNHLQLLITQSMVIQMHKLQAQQQPTSFLSPGLPLATPSELKTIPDLYLPIGNAEDRVMLVLGIRRSENLNHPLSLIRGILRQDTPEALLQTFKQQLEAHALHSWSNRNLHRVHMTSGTQQELYIVQDANLMQLFRSTLSRFFQSEDQQLEDQEKHNQEKKSKDSYFSDDEITNVGGFDASHGSNSIPLESVAGKNRFLGISPQNGQLYSVGQRNGNWVEWRDFLSEEFTSLLPNTRYYLDNILLDEFSYKANLKRKLETQPMLRLGIITEVDRIHLGDLIVKIVHDLHKKWHLKGLIHGDLKPANILITRDGIVLIDDFDQLKFGAISPGWTPAWSAPEQALGEPVSETSDLYALAKMLVRLLDVKIVGEVRKFRTAYSDREQDLFYNPFIYFPEDNAVITTEEGRKAWAKFLQQCLAFSPEKRPQTTEFIKQLTNLLKKYPLQGVKQTVFQRQIIVVKMPDGSKQIAYYIGAELNSENLFYELQPYGYFPPVYGQPVPYAPPQPPVYGQPVPYAPPQPPVYGQPVPYAPPQPPFYGQPQPGDATPNDSYFHLQNSKSKHDTKKLKGS